MHKKFKGLHEDILRAAGASDVNQQEPSIQDHRVTSRYGMVTFRSILERTLPVTLEDVLAFLYVSAALSEALNEEHSFKDMSRMELFRRDLARWETLIPDGELATFRSIVGVVWGGYHLELVQLRQGYHEHSNGTGDDLEYFQSLALRLISQAPWLCDAPQTLDSGILSSQWRWKQDERRKDITLRCNRRPAVMIPEPTGNHRRSITGSGSGGQKRLLNSTMHRGARDVSNWRPPENFEQLVILMLGTIFICALQFLFCKFSFPHGSRKVPGHAHALQL